MQNKDKKLIAFLKGSAILTTANMVLKAINFFLLPLYTKYLTPEALGVSDTITNVSAVIFPLLVMGLDSAFSAFYFEDRSAEHQKKVFNTIWFTLLLASAVPFLLIIGANFWSLMLFGKEGYAGLIAISLVGISMNLWYLPFALLVRMENRMAIFAVINITASLSMIGLNIFFVAGLKMGAAALILSSAIIQGLQLILYLILSHAKVNIQFYDNQLIKKMIKFALPLIPIAIVGWLLNLSDRYILLWYHGEVEVGIYGIAARFSSALAVFSNAVYMAYTTFAFDKQEDSNAQHQYSRILNAFFLILGFVCFTVSVFSKEIIILMTSKAYWDAYLMLPCILFGQLAYGVNTIVGYGISFAHKTEYTLLATTCGAGLNIVLNFIFIPDYGMVAAAATTFTSYVLMVILSYIFSQRVYPCKYRIARILLSGVILFAISQITINAMIGLKIAIWIAAGIILLFVFKDVIRDIHKLIKLCIGWIKTRKAN